MTTTLIVIASIIAILLMIAQFSGKKMIIECTVEIRKPLAEVFDFVRILKNHDSFSVWNMQDPEMKKEHRGTDGTVGFVYAWDSAKNKNVGAGEQEITLIEAGKRIDYEIRFSRPMENVAQSSMFFESISSDRTKVMWGFYSPMIFPMNLMKPIFKKMLTKDIVKGLQNLKDVMEK